MSYECKQCRSKTSLRSETIMIWSNDVLIKSTTKKGFSSKEIQRQYGLKSDERVWAIVLKLRKIMGIEMSDIRLEE